MFFFNTITFLRMKSRIVQKRFETRLWHDSKSFLLTYISCHVLWRRRKKYITFWFSLIQYIIYISIRYYNSFSFEKKKSIWFCIGKKKQFIFTYEAFDHMKKKTSININTRRVHLCNSTCICYETMKRKSAVVCKQRRQRPRRRWQQQQHTPYSAYNLTHEKGLRHMYFNFGWGK